ncbi:MAG: chemotaxis protein CheW [Synechococcales cyanobacterium CRU_2_2]|nr:chemotaxis protein CheW [Synechococcales cyanobacterium CRU_2_2]
MTTRTLNNPAASKTAPGSQNQVKLVVFPMGRLRLALPMAGISRVINLPEVHSSGLHTVGVTTVGNIQLMIVDLHRQLFEVSAPQAAGKSGYLVIMPTPAGYPIGIPIAETPILVDVPSSEIRALPDAYRRADTLSIASHITRITTEAGEVQSVFVLDIAAVVAQFAA